MGVIWTFLKSDLFGFMLKFVFGIATAIFAIYGIGVKTREDDGGPLTKPGKIALIGVLVCAAIGAASSLYDFYSGRVKDDAAREKSTKLLLAVQRGLYPLRGMSADLTIRFAQGVPELKEYAANLRRFLPRGQKDCVRTPDYSCGDRGDDETAAYEITQKSHLFPAPKSRAADFLDHLGIEILFISLNRQSPPDLYKLAGGIAFSVGTAADSVITYNPDTGRFTYRRRHAVITDSTDLYSLVEVFPGFASANVTTSIHPPGMDWIWDEVPYEDDSAKIEELTVHFPFPKALLFGEFRDFECTSAERGHLQVIMLPDDIDELDPTGNRHVDSSPYEKGVCSALANPGF
jgi:hypothetical protein